MSNAKVLINAQLGTVELEGEDSFVRTYLDILIPIIEQAQLGSGAAVQATGDPSTDEAGLAKPRIRQRGPQTPWGKSCRGANPAGAIRNRSPSTQGSGCLAGLRTTNTRRRNTTFCPRRSARSPSSYRCAVAADLAERIDLDGKPAGVVSPEDRHAAALVLFARAVKQQSWQRKPSRPGRPSRLNRER